jgi:hypothetical protein
MQLASLFLLLGAAQTPTPDSLDFVVWNHGRRAGEMQVVTTGDSVAVHYLHVDRQRGPRIEGFYRLREGRPVWAKFAAAGRRPPPPTFRAIRSRSPPNSSSCATAWCVRGPAAIRPPPALPPGAFYLARTATPYDDAALAAYLLRQPQHRAPTVPQGTARVEVAFDTSLVLAGRPTPVRLAVIDGAGLAPSLVWLDERGQLFASNAGWFIAVRRGAEQLLPALRAFELRYLEARDAALAARFAPKSAPALVIRNGDLFDSETGKVRARTSVVIVNDRIVAVGPADSVKTPSGATVIDASGKTIIPGLWDMHTHAFQGSADGVLQLATGITTVRDMASDRRRHLRRARADPALCSARASYSPVYRGTRKWAGPQRSSSTPKREARLAARYDSLGYKQIKLYNLVHPDLFRSSPARPTPAACA